MIFDKTYADYVRNEKRNLEFTSVSGFQDCAFPQVFFSLDFVLSHAFINLLNFQTFIRLKRL